MIGNRRSFLKVLASGSALGVLGACTVTTSGQLTIVTLNVAKVKAYGTAGINAVTTILSLAAVSSAVGAPAMAIIEASGAALQAALTAFSNAAGSSTTVTYDSTCLKTQVDSLLTDLQNVTSLLGNAVSQASTAVPGSTLANANTVISALKTVLSIFQGGLRIVSVSGPRMAEKEALRTLHVSL
ncbi:hypothetical protein Gbth_080_021 [Gluconobacter thailandicus F149-1 = NBRC 100600]|uniref:Twin-arginine translocation signal domain-containing protein n=1 Tax=Gluconobacter thailandicus NBRC 3257 TaxID=1381097 RepID=A0ABQ0J0I2_GLUTH|nr:twin-arginine translocation signal domain-containing protein [Gluconobacter thailandicus]KXV52866.1 hypothetical protein AD946_10085 [Gluconobacter thailandicus]GAD27971.1 hypothetical protein NBRC3257_2970 [Gluconobacter thailandicus NBRC 3257]GAN94689.1 hypothetical protein Gbth_080_021 [Gluconobacter thailandicus F149-1 = NBRC 100600]GBR59803.1 hypothetical protein AA100600_1496 [Gluconobacter thailandicus F149-1 = NBRC 100600]GEL86754.1 hypothetical protein GTH01_11120 [Gluconobacter th